MTRGKNSSEKITECEMWRERGQEFRFLSDLLLVWPQTESKTEIDNENDEKHSQQNKRKRLCDVCLPVFA